MFVTTAKRKSLRGAITVVRLVHGYREDGKSNLIQRFDEQINKIGCCRLNCVAILDRPF